MKNNSNNPNPYIIAILTAVLAAILSVVGGYFTSKIQTENAILEKQFEYRASAYNSFLESVTPEKSPMLAKMLSLGKEMNFVHTDGEVQSLENESEKLMKEYYASDLAWKLDYHFNILRVHGSEKVRKYCDDINLVLNKSEYQVDWSKYSPKIQKEYAYWAEISKTEANPADDYVDPKIMSQERMMIEMSSVLYAALIEQLNSELHSHSL